MRNELGSIPGNGNSTYRRTCKDPSQFWCQSIGRAVDVITYRPSSARGTLTSRIAWTESWVRAGELLLPHLARLYVSGAGAPCFMLIAPLSSFPPLYGCSSELPFTRNCVCTLFTELVEARLCPALSDSTLQKMVALRLCLGWETWLRKWVLTTFPMQIQDQNDRALWTVFPVQHHTWGTGW